MQDETRRGDDAVAALLLDAGQAGQKLVGDILAQSGLAECTAGDSEYLRRSMRRFAIRLETADAKSGFCDIMDLAEVVIQTLDIHPQTIRCDHAP